MRSRQLLVACAVVARCQSPAPAPLDPASIKSEIEAATVRLSRGFEIGQMDSAAAVLTEDHYSMPPNDA